MAHHQYPAQRGAGYGHEKTEDFGDIGDLGLAEAEVAVKRARHGAHGDIAQLVGANQQEDQHRQRAVALEEFHEGTDHGIGEPGGQSLPR